MKTTILQSLFKIALLLFGMVVGVGCDDSDNPDNRIQEGIEISGILTKTVENGTEIKYPTEITPFLTLRKDLTFEGDAVCNSIVLTFACVSLLVNAQLSTNELPFSFRVENQHLFIQKNAQINSYKALLPKTVEELNTEDQENEGDNENVPPRFGYPIPVNGI